MIDRQHFEPLQRFLTDDTDLRKRYQLAERLADLFDQYQVYRADWLEDWAKAAITYAIPVGAKRKAADPCQLLAGRAVARAAG